MSEFRCYTHIAAHVQDSPTGCKTKAEIPPIGRISVVPSTSCIYDVVLDGRPCFGPLRQVRFIQKLALKYLLTGVASSMLRGLR